MYHLPFKSDLVYSVQNEDDQTQLTLLCRIFPGTPLHLLLVASSGENALTLFTQNIYMSYAVGCSSGVTDPRRTRVIDPL